MTVPPPASSRGDPQGADAEEARIPRAGETIASRYRIDGYLGRGGMGAVLSATHVVTGKRCAIKWVLPRGDERKTGRERLLREARMAGRIDHPNVVHVVDVGEHRGSIFLVMELLRGESLKAWIGRGPIATGEAVRLMMPVMRGVAAAHEVGIVHRDLKPDNVLLARGDDAHAVRPTVLDFGISRSADDGLAGDLTLTQTGVMVGTPLYMAPEQLAGASEVDPRYDVYALGVILYELVTGARPFEGDTYALLVSAKLNGSPIPPSRWRGDLDARFEKVLLRAMSRRPSSRYGSVQALATALEPFAEGCAFADSEPYWREAGEASGDRTIETSARASVRRGSPWVPAFAAAVLLGLLAGVWWSSRSVDDGAERARAQPLAAVAAPRPAALADAGPAEDEPDGDEGAGSAGAIASEATDGEDPGGAARRVGRPRGRTGRLRVSEF